MEPYERISSIGPAGVVATACRHRDIDLAVRALQRAVTMDPNNSITHHLLGQAYRDLGRNEDAERELKLAEQLQERDSGKQ